MPMYVYLSSFKDRLYPPLIAKTRFKRGLLIDLHGQHTTQVTELGYCIPKSQLINQNYNVEQSSVAKLCSESNDVISGSKSLGSFIESHGYEAMPSMTHPKPSE